MTSTRRACALVACLTVAAAITACGGSEPSNRAEVLGTVPPGTAGGPAGTTAGTASSIAVSPPSSTAATGAPPTIAAPRELTNVPAGVGVSVVAQDLAAPWGVTFTPDGNAWVTERDTGLVKVITPGGTPQQVLRLPSAAGGEAGLLGIAASPAYATDGFLYVYFTSEVDNRVVRVRPTDGRIENVITGIPKAAIHDGGRLAFGPDGKLYIGTGDAADKGNAQDRDSLAGKILRLEPNGSIPADNPFASPVWTLGHRNVQGLAWDRAGRMYATEFGPDVDDEVNLIVKGSNYGWPEVTGDSGGRFTDPLLVLQPPEASPSGLVYLDQAGAWSNSLLFGGLRGSRVYRVPILDDGRLGAPEQTFRNTFGRVRMVTRAPDGSIWLLSNNRDGRGAPRPGDDLIVRITPPS